MPTGLPRSVSHRWVQLMSIPNCMGATSRTALSVLVHLELSSVFLSQVFRTTSLLHQVTESWDPVPEGASTLSVPLPPSDGFLEAEKYSEWPFSPYALLGRELFLLPLTSGPQRFWRSRAQRASRAKSFLSFLRNLCDNNRSGSLCLTVNQNPSAQISTSSRGAGVRKGDSACVG